MDEKTGQPGSSAEDVRVSVMSGYLDEESSDYDIYCNSSSSNYADAKPVSSLFDDSKITNTTLNKTSYSDSLTASQTNEKIQTIRYSVSPRNPAGIMKLLQSTGGDDINPLFLHHNRDTKERATKKTGVRRRKKPINESASSTKKPTFAQNNQSISTTSQSSEEASDNNEPDKTEINNEEECDIIAFDAIGKGKESQISWSRSTTEITQKKSWKRGSETSYSNQLTSQDDIMKQEEIEETDIEICNDKSYQKLYEEDQEKCQETMVKSKLELCENEEQHQDSMVKSKVELIANEDQHQTKSKLERRRPLSALNTKGRNEDVCRMIRGKYLRNECCPINRYREYLSPEEIPGQDDDLYCPNLNWDFDETDTELVFQKYCEELTRRCQCENPAGPIHPEKKRIKKSNNNAPARLSVIVKLQAAAKRRVRGENNAMDLHQRYTRLWQRQPAPGSRLRTDVIAGVKARTEAQERRIKEVRKEVFRPTVFVPNNYVPPTSKKRMALRWRVRCALEQYLSPGAGLFHVPAPLAH